MSTVLYYQQYIYPSRVSSSHQRPVRYDADILLLLSFFHTAPTAHDTIHNLTHQGLLRAHMASEMPPVESGTSASQQQAPNQHRGFNPPVYNQYAQQTGNYQPSTFPQQAAGYYPSVPLAHSQQTGTYQSPTYPPSSSAYTTPQLFSLFFREIDTRLAQLKKLLWVQIDAAVQSQYENLHTEREQDLQETLRLAEGQLLEKMRDSARDSKAEQVLELKRIQDQQKQLGDEVNGLRAELNDSRENQEKLHQALKSVQFSLTQAQQNLHARERLAAPQLLRRSKRRCTSAV